MLAESLGIPKEEVEKAREDRAEKVKLTLDAQTTPEERLGARGFPEGDPNPNSGEEERAEDEEKRGEQEEPTEEDE